MSVPAANELAGMLMVALPALSVVAAEVYVPLVRVTEPVGVGLPLPPLTVTFTANGCVVVMLVGDGVTVNVGVNLAAAVMLKSTTFDVPPPGVGLKTVTGGLLTVETSADGTIAVS